MRQGRESQAALPILPHAFSWTGRIVRPPPPEKVREVDVGVGTDGLNVCVNDCLSVTDQRDCDPDCQELCIGAVVLFELVHSPLCGGPLADRPNQDPLTAYARSLDTRGLPT